MVLSQPHNNFFIAALDDVNLVSELLCLLFNQTQIDALDFNSLERAPENYIDEYLSAFRTDITFRIKSKSDPSRWLYMVLEHKSHRSNRPELQLLRYDLRIFKAVKNPAPVINILVCHGKRGWKIHDNFHDSLDLLPEIKEAFGPYILNFKNFILPLFNFEFHEYDLTLKLRIFLFSLKHIHDFSEESRLVDLLVFARELFFDDSATEFIGILLVYIYRVHDHTIERICEFVDRYVQQGKGDIVMTTAERLIEQGIEKGIEKGELLGTLKNIRGLLEVGVDWKSITAATGFTSADYTELMNQHKFELLTARHRY